MTAPRPIATNVFTIEILPNRSAGLFLTEGLQNARAGMNCPWGLCAFSSL
jgi:hypothetical protein